MTGKHRGDDPGYTGCLFDRLRDEFEPQQLFLDVHSIAPGLDFVRVVGAVSYTHLTLPTNREV